VNKNKEEVEAKAQVRGEEEVEEEE